MSKANTTHKLKVADLARLEYNIEREKDIVLHGIVREKWGRKDAAFKLNAITAMANTIRQIREYGESEEPDFIVKNWGNVIDLMKYGIDV